MSAKFPRGGGGGSRTFFSSKSICGIHSEMFAFDVKPLYLMLQCNVRLVFNSTFGI